MAGLHTSAGRKEGEEEDKASVEEDRAVEVEGRRVAGRVGTGWAGTHQ